MLLVGNMKNEAIKICNSTTQCEFLSLIYKLFCLHRVYGEREKEQREKGENIPFICTQEGCSYKDGLG